MAQFSFRDRLPRFVAFALFAGLISGAYPVMAKTLQLVALGDSLTAGYLGGKVRDIVPYVTVLVILLVRPYGLFGTRQIERL